MRNQAGFSLTEVLISLLVLSILSVLVVGVIPATVLGLRSAGQRMTAAQISRNELERMRQLGLDQLQDTTLTPITLNGTDYTGEIEIGPATDSANQPLDPARARLVTVTVRWRGRGGTSYQYEARNVLVRQI
jgi:prepilin-type N-terminal cleavage/methylation domain-containing protein